MARNLQDNCVTEIYVSDGSVNDSKNVLFVYKDGSLGMKWCMGEYVEEQANPTLVKVGRKMFLEYGEPNLFMIRERMPFQDEMGNLEKVWEKVM